VPAGGRGRVDATQDDIYASCAKVLARASGGSELVECAVSGVLIDAGLGRGNSRPVRRGPPVVGQGHTQAV